MTGARGAGIFGWTDPAPTAAGGTKPAAAPAVADLITVERAAEAWRRLDAAARAAAAARDAAVLAAFADGYGGQEIARAAGMSLSGVYRMQERAVGKVPPSRRPKNGGKSEVPGSLPAT